MPLSQQGGLLAEVPEGTCPWRTLLLSLLGTYVENDRAHGPQKKTTVVAVKVMFYEDRRSAAICT